MKDTPTTVDVATILAEFAQLKALYVKTVVELETLKKSHQALLERYRALEKSIFFRGREKLGSPEQGLMEFMTPPPPAPPAAPPPEDPRKARAKPTGRKPLPENLPVVPIEVLPDEVQAAGLDAFERIGQDVSESVERRAASLVVVRVIRPKFVRKSAAGSLDQPSSTVVQAAAVELPIERGLAGPGLLASTIVQRWDDHSPLHRMERIFGREGWDLSRSTICDWHLALAALAKPVVDAMWADARRAPLLCTDATGVLVQALEKCRRAHFFVVAAPQRHILFGYSPKHDSAAIDKLIGDFEGALVADASTIYDHLYQRGKIKEHGCWAHVRRYFFKAIDSDSARSRIAIREIGRLFEIERELAGVADEQRRHVRDVKSRPVVAAFFDWCNGERPHVLSESPIDKALQYAQNQRAALEAFLGTPRAPIHNNLSERELRREAVGRKNWLFIGSDDGGETNATFVSLLASCRHLGIEPLGYLRDLFCLLPSWNQQRVLELSPLHWKATIARDEVRAQLEANVYRQVALGLRQPTSP